MLKKLLLAISAAFAAAAQDIEGSAAPAAETPTPEPASPKGKRGRPPVNPTPPPAEKEPEPTNTPEPEAQQPEAPKGDTVDTLRKLFEPLVKSGRGAEVKAAIAKFAPALVEIKESDYPAFRAEIEGLLL